MLQAEEGGLSSFLLKYLDQVNVLLALIEGSRSGDFNLYLKALEQQVKYFFSRDLLHYARLIPLHLAEMNALKNSDEQTWKAL